MPTYEIKSVEESGVYVVVTREDGSTFGQIIQNVDLSNEEAALQSIQRQIENIAGGNVQAITLGDLAKYAGTSVGIDVGNPVNLNGLARVRRQFVKAAKADPLKALLEKEGINS